MIRLVRLFRIFLILWLALGALAWAGPVSQGGATFFTDADFQRLAEELAPKVNLFEEAWKQDAEAEFYGGTTRDYLYWLKGQLAGARSHEEALKMAKRLKSLRVIDVRDFLMHESDVDISSGKGVSITAQDFGVKKIDSIKAAVFDPSSEEGLNEKAQGYIPAEKIRLGKKGFILDPEFKNGISEIRSGRLTVHFTPPEVFAKSHYAQKGLNHPILLALRYLRLQAINYFKEHGDGYPDLESLLDMDPQSKEAVKEVIQKCLDGQELKHFLANQKSAEWLNGTIRKGFRSYTNPTAMMELVKAFHVDELIGRYSLDPINQFLFAKYRDPDQVAANFQKYHMTPKSLYEPIAKHFSDGRYYHGTPTDEGFRDITLQGVRPSVIGVAGDGLYGVATEHRKYSEDSYCGGDPNRLVSFQVDPRAHIVDITQGEGRTLYERFHRKPGSNFSSFAEAFGIDILLYDFQGDTPRYITKNAAVLGEPKGVYRQVLTFSKAIEMAEKVTSPQELSTFIESLKLSRFRTSDLEQLAKAVPKKALFDPMDYFKALAVSGKSPSTVGPFFPFYRRNEVRPDQESELIKLVLSALPGPDRGYLLAAWFDTPICLRHPEVLHSMLEMDGTGTLSWIYGKVSSGSAQPKLLSAIERENEYILRALKKAISPGNYGKHLLEESSLLSKWLGDPSSVRHPEILWELNQGLERSYFEKSHNDPFALEKLARKYSHWRGKEDLFHELRADFFGKMLDRAFLEHSWIGWLYSPSVRKDPRWAQWRGKFEQFLSSPKRRLSGDDPLFWQALLKCKTPDEFIVALAGNVKGHLYEPGEDPLGNIFSALNPSARDWNKLRRDCLEKNKKRRGYSFSVIYSDLNLRAVEARDAKTPAEVINALSQEWTPEDKEHQAFLERIANENRERFLAMNPKPAEKAAFERVVLFNRGDYRPFGSAAVGCLVQKLFNWTQR